MDEEEERDAVFYQTRNARVSRRPRARGTVCLSLSSLKARPVVHYFVSAEADHDHGIGFPKTAPASPTPSTP